MDILALVRLAAEKGASDLHLVADNAPIFRINGRLQPEADLPTLTTDDIAQAFQYALTGAVDAGFCALSAAYSEEGKKGCFLAVDEAPAVVQAACLLKKKENADAAKKFAEFLVSDEARTIMAKYGYK